MSAFLAPAFLAPASLRTPARARALPPPASAMRPTSAIQKPPPPRPVFFRAALARLRRQPAHRRARALRHTVSALLSTLSWWVRTGLPQLPPTLLALRHRRATLALRAPAASPSVDVYAAPSHAAYLSARLATPPRAHAPPRAPVVVYVHGGAWGSGHASQYAHLASALVRRTAATVLVLSYRLYPAACMRGQHADVAAALRRARALFPARPLAVLAHSSGAHLAALALLRAAEERTPAPPLADLLIASAGPYHLMHHFLFEARRGVAEVSPMLPAARADADPRQFIVTSPTCVAETMRTPLHEVPGLPQRPAVLEGQLPATNLRLPPAKAGQGGALFPRTYVVTSSCDTVVPCYSSIRFAAALRERGLDTELLVYDGMEHVEFVTDWFGGGGRDQSAVFDVGEADRERRRKYRTMLHGEAMADVCEGGDAGEESAYVRDVVRILNELVEKDHEEGEGESRGSDKESDEDEPV